MTQEMIKYTGQDPAGQAAVKDRDISFLMYGDAGDGFMAKDICELAAQAGLSPKSGTKGQSPYCLLEGLHLVSQLIAGVQPQGPYAQGFTEEDAPGKAIPRGLATFKELTGKSKPDVLVFSGLLQDVRRMLQHNQQEMSQEFLSKEHVQTWMEQTSAQLTSLESQYDNKTMLVFHGAVYPMLMDCKHGGDHANAMGKRTHIIQLNKAALHVMQEHPRWHLVDFDQMSMPFSLTGLHLRDGIHPGPPFLAQVLNIYLNLYKQHLAETGQKPLPERSPMVSLQGQQQPQAMQMQLQQQQQQQEGIPLLPNSPPAGAQATIGQHQTGFGSFS